MLRTAGDQPAGRSLAEVLSQALSLALAGSIYPPAVAAVIALGRGPQVRSRVFAFVFAAALVTYASGVLLLFLFDELGVSTPGRPTPGAAIDIALGVALVLLAIYLRRKRPARATAGKSSKVERYLREPPARVRARCDPVPPALAAFMSPQSSRPRAQRARRAANCSRWRRS